jgi:outer membrane receptor for ferrienterochelin and colicins
MKLGLIVCATAALAACSAPEPDYTGVAARLDQAREEITPSLGATMYTLDSRRLLDQPGDENRSLAQSPRQLPGVALGPSGELRVRGQ